MAEEEQQVGHPREETGESAPPMLPRTYGQLHPQQSSAAPKVTWPEVVGLLAEDAEKKIKEDIPGAQIQVVPPDCFVTMDFNSRRVRLYVDSSRKVRMSPRVG